MRVFSRCATMKEPEPEASPTSSPWCDCMGKRGRRHGGYGSVSRCGGWSDENSLWFWNLRAGRLLGGIALCRRWATLGMIHRVLGDHLVFLFLFLFLFLSLFIYLHLFCCVVELYDICRVEYLNKSRRNLRVYDVQMGHWLLVADAHAAPWHHCLVYVTT